MTDTAPPPSHHQAAMADGQHGEQTVDPELAAGRIHALNRRLLAVAGPGPLRWPGALPLPTWWMLLVAAVGGGALFAAFPPIGWWPLAPVGVAALVVAVAGRRARAAMAAGLVFSLVFFGALVWWLNGNIGIGAWVALTLSESVLLAVMTAPLPLLLSLPARPLVIAVWWTGTEAVRSRQPLGGFPWGRLAFSQEDSPALGWARLGGAPAVTFVTALAAGALAVVVLAPSMSARWRGAVWTAAALGIAVAVPVPSANRGRPATAVIALVQGDVDRARTLDEQVRVRDVADRHLAATENLARQIDAGLVPRPDLVLWPENAMDDDPRTDPYLHQVADEAVAVVGRPILLGAILDGAGGRTYNAGLLWRPGTGADTWYAKRQLVPFGEYIPARSIFGGMGQLQLIPRDFSPGSGSAVMTVGSIRLGDVICYEIGYDRLVRDAVHGGADLLVEQTNDSTFIRDGSTGETEQQLAMARLRAVEHDRAVAVVSTTGVSAVIRPDGTVAQRTPVWTQQVLSATVPLRTDVSVADRMGSWPEGAVCITAVGLLAAAVIRTRRTSKTD